MEIRTAMLQEAHHTKRKKKRSCSRAAPFVSVVPAWPTASFDFEYFSKPLQPPEQECSNRFADSVQSLLGDDLRENIFLVVGKTPGQPDGRKHKGHLPDLCITGRRKLHLKQRATGRAVPVTPDPYPHGVIHFKKFRL